KRVQRLMRMMGLQALYPKPRTTQPNRAHRIYPYLLRDLVIDRPNQVWCADITYIPMARGFAYVVAIMDWASRKVLSWRVSNTMDTTFCIEALREALQTYGPPEIFNTDQGSQFTSTEFTSILEDAGIRISMDGRGRWLDNVFIERLWRSLKYEEVDLHAYDSVFDADRGIGNWLAFYNT
ncbi:MAG: IS3 family transposase, partial [Nitrospira sp.]|nr:IS3 family transposase [Nitrospira sp.]